MTSSSSDNGLRHEVEEWESLMESPDSFVPKSGSSAYTYKSYWDWRFAREPEKEWLAAYSDMRDAINRHVSKSASVLLIGCGNSHLAEHMADDGFTNITSSDYSEIVIDFMRRRTEAKHPHIRWVTADMMNLRGAFPAASFDAVIDKAAMDAVLADGGDTWDPPVELLSAGASIADGVAGVLRPSGVFLQLTFSQPHFRKPYLHAGGALHVVSVQNIDVGLGYSLLVARPVVASTDATRDGTK